MMNGPTQGGPPQRSNGVPWAPGFVPFSLIDIARLLHENDYPAEMILHPIDFSVLTASMGNGLQPNFDDETKRHYVYIGNCRVFCRASRPDGVLDMSERQASRVVLADAGGIVSPLQ